MKSLGRIVAIALFAGLLAGGSAPTPPMARAAAWPTAPSPEGGNRLICVATGLLFGAAILSGNALAAGGAVVSAIKHGCL